MYAIDFDVVGFDIAESGYLSGIKKWMEENDLQECESLIEDMDNMVFIVDYPGYNKQAEDGFYLLTHQEQGFIKWAQKLINEGVMNLETSYSGDSDMPVWLEYKKETRTNATNSKRESYQKLMELEDELQGLIDNAPDEVKKFLLGKDLITEIHTTS